MKPLQSAPPRGVENPRAATAVSGPEARSCWGWAAPDGGLNTPAACPCSLPSTKSPVRHRPAARKPGTHQVRRFIDGLLSHYSASANRRVGADPRSEQVRLEAGGEVCVGPKNRVRQPCQGLEEM